MPPRRQRGRPAHGDVLTPGEWRIAQAVRHGLTNREIAARRGISADAVKYHVANILVKLGLQNRRALKQWVGAPIDSALKRGISMTATLSLGRIGQVARTVKDIQKAETWYRDVLRLPHLYTFGKLAFFDCAGTRLLLSEVEGTPPPESILYLMVEDIEAAHRELQARGVDFISAPHMIHKHADGTEEWMAFFKDLEGRPLAIMGRSG